ncbi:PTS galactitol transporter subunit IIC [Stomatohabitans albus]|uniref:PTS galactitol transporter subunit IIC n=1 Tax=Stomatohabitans albus TaxID=3110766 RepID=UPI00300C5AB0
MAFIQYILDLGPAIVLPIIMFGLGMILRMPVGRSFRSALTIGVGFIAINLVIGLMGETLGPTTQKMVENIGVNLPIVDVGWPVAATIAFGTASVVPWIFLLGIVTNLAMIALNWTKTLNVDMWNYWHFIFSAAFVHVITGNFILAIGIGILTSVIVLKLADALAPVIQDVYQMPGITTPHTETAGLAPLTWVLNKGIDRVPGLNKLHATPEDIQEKWGVIGEPMMMGTVLGGLIAILAYYPDFATDPGDAFANILRVSITLGAVMLVLPRMVAILMEGLVPISDAAKKFISSRFPGRELYIGLDAAILIGAPANMSTAIIMVPITLVLAILMSFIGLNKMLPFTDLATLPFFCIWATTWHRGNIIRSTVIMSIVMTFYLAIGTFLADATTQLAIAAQFDMPDNAQLISSIDSGAHLVPFLLVFPFMLDQINAYGPNFMVFTGFIVGFTLISYIVFFVKYLRGDVIGMEDKHLYVTEDASDDESWDDYTASAASTEGSSDDSASDGGYT